MKKKITIWEGDASKINNLKAQSNVYLYRNMPNYLGKCGVLYYNSYMTLEFIDPFNIFTFKNNAEKGITYAYYISTPSVITVTEGAIFFPHYNVFKKKTLGTSQWSNKISHTDTIPKIITQGLVMFVTYAPASMVITPVSLYKQNDLADLFFTAPIYSFNVTLQGIIEDYTPSRIFKVVSGNNTYLGVTGGGGVNFLYTSAKVFTDALIKYDKVFLIPYIMSYYESNDTPSSIQPIGDNTWENLGLQELYDEYVRRYGNQIVN